MSAWRVLAADWSALDTGHTPPALFDAADAGQQGFLARLITAVHPDLSACLVSHAILSCGKMYTGLQPRRLFVEEVMRTLRRHG